jgi:hypothetical protein
MPVASKRSMWIGHDIGLARLDRLEHVGIGHQAQALVPRIVGRGEGLGIVLVAQRRLDLLGQVVLDLFRLAAGALEHQVLQPHVLEAGDRIGDLFRQDAAQRVGQGIARGRIAYHVGVRCSMVTCAALCVIDGTIVTAVAPEPITTTRLPA